MKKFPSIYFLLLLGIGLLTYTALRAYHLSLTCDEASTYLSHTDRNLWMCFFSENCWSDANNHWLNTFLMQKSIAIFGVSEWSLRLPNLLGHLLYLISSIVLIKNISTNTWVALGGFCLLNFNPFLLEFFSLARGYGLGVGCMMMSLTLFFLWLKKYRFSFLIGSFLMAALAVLSNFIFLNYFACLTATFAFFLLLEFFQKRERTIFNKTITPFAISLFLFFILKKPIQTLRSKGEFVFGTDSLSNTFYDLVLDSVMAQGYLYPYTSDVFFYVSILFLTIAGVIGITYFLKKKGQDKFAKIYFASVLLLLLMLIALVVQYHFLDVKYLVDRKSVILIPLVSVPVYLLLEWMGRMKLKPKPPNPLKGERPLNSPSILIDDKSSGHPFRGLGGLESPLNSPSILVDGKSSGRSPFRGLGGLGFNFILPILFTLFFLNHFQRTYNFTRSTEWSYDAHTKEMMKFVKDNLQKNEKTDLGVFWIFGPASEFYHQQFFLKEKINLIRLEEEELSTANNFQHIYVQKSQEGILPKMYQIEKRFGEAGILYSRRDQ